MKTNTSLVAVSFALAAIFTSPAFAADPTKPDADHLLRQMSTKLASAKSFSFHARREIDPALLPGGRIAEKAQVEVSVARPNKINVQSSSKDGARRFLADGRNLTLVDEKMNHYATVPMHTSLDGLVAQLDEKYGFTPPLAEFALSDPYKDIREQADAVTYLGRGRVGGGFLGMGGVECDRIALNGKMADAELWIGVNDQLPHKMIATFKHHAGRPQLKAEFSDWNLAARVPAQEFAFAPAKGAMKIPMKTTAEMEIASRKN